MLFFRHTEQIENLSSQDMSIFGKTNMNIDCIMIGAYDDEGYFFGYLREINLLKSTSTKLFITWQRTLKSFNYSNSCDDLPLARISVKQAFTCD